MQESDGLGGVRSLDGAGDGAVFFAEFATRLIAVQQRLGGAGVADDVVAQVSSNALGAVAPEGNSLLHIDDAEAGGQALENAAADVGIMK